MQCDYSLFARDGTKRGGVSDAGNEAISFLSKKLEAILMQETELFLVYRFAFLNGCAVSEELKT